MSKSLVQKAPLPTLFDEFGLSTVSTEDQFTMKFTNGILDINIKRSDGRSETVKKVAGAGFKQFTSFDPSQMDVRERNQLIIKMYSQGETQSTLATRFGLSQSMVSKIIKS